MKEINPEFQTILIGSEMHKGCLCISWQTVCMLWWISVKTNRGVSKKERGERKYKRETIKKLHTTVRVAADCMHRGGGWWCQVENLSYVQLYQTCQNKGHLQSPPLPPPPAWGSTLPDTKFAQHCCSNYNRNGMTLLTYYTYITTGRCVEPWFASLTF